MLHLQQTYSKYRMSLLSCPCAHEALPHRTSSSTETSCDKRQFARPSQTYRAVVPCLFHARWSLLSPKSQTGSHSPVHHHCTCTALTLHLHCTYTALALHYSLLLVYTLNILHLSQNNGKCLKILSQIAHKENKRQHEGGAERRWVNTDGAQAKLISHVFTAEFAA
jgi:hypothetical protein